MRQLKMAIRVILDPSGKLPEAIESRRVGRCCPLHSGYPSAHLIRPHDQVWAVCGGDVATAETTPNSIFCLRSEENRKKVATDIKGMIAAVAQLCIPWHMPKMGFYRTRRYVKFRISMACRLSRMQSLSKHRYRPKPRIKMGLNHSRRDEDLCMLIVHRQHRRRHEDLETKRRPRRRPPHHSNKHDKR